MVDETKSTPSQKREIRAFISSTFRDLQEEREELVKHVFPKLRKLCEERGVTWREVDLRWGVTEARAEHGDVLPICLAEIERCRPYFIGLLAERYGSLPQKIPTQLLKEEPWLAEYGERSLTELEIIHGVLRNPAMAGRACFYFRDPSYVNQVPLERRPDFVEENPEARKKLAQLKERIRGSKLPVREDYRNPRALGELVLRDLTAAISRQFPLEETPDPLEREALEHEMFARSRRDLYIGRREYFERLNEQGSGNADGSGLVVLGESGSGKSALLSNWVFEYRKDYPEDLVIMHFIGATPYSTDWTAMLRRIMGELKRRFNITQDIPDKPDELRSAFANWLNMAAARGRVVLILDALNQLEDRDGAPDLVWLPPVIPGNVRLVVSTLSGRPLEELTRRGWPALQVKPLEEGEREQLIGQYLKELHRKELSDERVRRIAATAQSANPLYLQALLEELRLFGEHERLDERIGYYLGAGTVEELYERILERYEADYERDHPGLVSDAMTFLWAARRGLSEGELLELLGEDGEPLPQAFWSPFYLAAERSLVSRSGLIGFFHDYLREAVANAYVPTQELKRAAHIRLAHYFERRDLTPRTLAELPWQLAEATAWNRLLRLLTDPVFFKALWQADDYDLKAYWERIEKNSRFRCVDAYAKVLRRPSAFIAVLDDVRELFWLRGNLNEALEITRFQSQLYRFIGETHNLHSCLLNQANICCRQGNIEEALGLCGESERLCRELGDRLSLGRVLNDFGLLLRGREENERALALFKEAEDIFRETREKLLLQATLVNQATIHFLLHDVDRATALYKEAARICTELGDKEHLQQCLIGLGLCEPEADMKMVLYNEAESICRDLGIRNELALVLGCKATVESTRGNPGRALALLREQEAIWRNIGNLDGVARSLWLQALTLSEDMGNHKEALSLAEEAGALFTGLQTPDAQRVASVVAEIKARM